MPFAGGNWNNTSGGGVLALNLKYARSNSNSNIGFRSALPSYVRLAGGLWTTCRYARGKGACFHSDRRKTTGCMRAVSATGQRPALSHRRLTAWSENLTAASSWSESRYAG